jgi:hypothetical protein
MNIKEVLLNNYIDKQWSITDNKYEGLEWLDDSPKPTETELESQWEEVQAKLAADEQAKIDAKASAIEKLKNLGLTVEEVKVAFGLEQESN